MRNMHGIEFLLNNTGYYTGGRKDPLDGRKMARMRLITGMFGNPQDAFKSVHIAGTKGKGSTAALAAAALTAHGYKTGLYTSPHVSEIEERIQVDGKPIETAELSELVEKIKPALAGPDPPTFFEAMTLAAFLYFRENGVDWAVVEAGIGGRFSATNVIDAECACVTGIGKEHAEIISPDTALIAAEKAGIARKDKPLVVGPLEAAAMDVIEKECRDTGAKLRVVTEPLNVRLALAGRHQRWNAACALEILKALREGGSAALDDERAVRAFEAVTLPGRFEVFDGEPVIILDGAHTADSARKLLETADEHFNTPRFVLVFAAKEGKQIRGMLSSLLPRAKAAVLTTCGDPGFVKPEDLEEIAREFDTKTFAVGEPADAFSRAVELAAEGTVVVTGSFYLVGEIRALLKNGA